MGGVKYSIESSGDGRVVGEFDNLDDAIAAANEWMSCAEPEDLEEGGVEIITAVARSAWQDGKSVMVELSPRV